MFKLLIVEDDARLNNAICTFLNKNGYETKKCLNADEAYDAMYNDIFDLIISDIMMPGTDGFEFAKTVRDLDREIPILFVTAREDKLSKQKGFEIGIDDYMVKPVEFDELLWRTEALLRRAKISKDKSITLKSLTMNADEHTAYVNGEIVPLTVREFNILYKLLSYPKKAFTRAQLMDEFWGGDTNSTARTVDIYITKLRDKFSQCEDFKIVTVYGLGYKAVIENEK